MEDWDETPDWSDFHVAEVDERDTGALLITCRSLKDGVAEWNTPCVNEAARNAFTSSLALWDLQSQGDLVQDCERKAVVAGEDATLASSDICMTEAKESDIGSEAALYEYRHDKASRRLLASSSTLTELKSLDEFVQECEQRVDDVHMDEPMDSSRTFATQTGESDETRRAIDEALVFFCRTPCTSAPYQRVLPSTSPLTELRSLDEFVQECEQGDGIVRISVQTLSEPPFEIPNVHCHISVAKLVILLETYLKIPPCKMRLVYGTTVLDDFSRSLAGYGITPPNATITIVRVPQVGCTVTFQAERFNPAFPLASVILGESNRNLSHIFRKSGRPIQLRVQEGGEGNSMFLWLPYLHNLGLCHCMPRGKQVWSSGFTIEVVTDLLDHVCALYNEWALAKNLPHLDEIQFVIVEGTYLPTDSRILGEGLPEHALSTLLTSGKAKLWGTSRGRRANPY